MEFPVVGDVTALIPKTPPAPAASLPPSQIRYDADPATVEVRRVQAPIHGARPPRPADPDMTQELPVVGVYERIHEAGDWPDEAFPCLTGCEPADAELEAMKAWVEYSLAPEPATSMDTAVRLFRAARDMGRRRRAWCDEADARLRTRDMELKGFNDRWKAFDDSVEATKAALDAAATAKADAELVAAYADGGTSVALYKIEELQQELARHGHSELAGAAR